MKDKMSYDMVIEYKNRTPNDATVRVQVARDIIVRRYASASFDEMGLKSVFGVIKRATPNEEAKR